MFATLKQILPAAILMGALTFSATHGVAQDKMTVPSSGPSWGPQFTLPKMDEKCVHDADFAKTGKCVRDTEFMRRNHMDVLNHKRDTTMYTGIRTKNASLQNCINCHVTKDDAGKVIKVSNPKHFCASCHLFVSVKLDCFECHRSTPDTQSLKAKGTARIPNIPAHTGLFASNSAEAKSLQSFLAARKNEGVTK